jgi:hypothetical protein
MFKTRLAARFLLSPACMEKTSLYQDTLFKRIVIASTGLGLACMFASLAAIRIDPGRGLQFTWHWSILIVVAAAVLWNWRFWNVVWAAQVSPVPAAKRKVAMYVTVLLLLGTGSFLYPIRFLEHGYWNGILRGLLTAGAFLGTMIWLIYKCGKGLVEIDKIELERQRAHDRILRSLIMPQELFLNGEDGLATIPPQPAVNNFGGKKRKRSFDRKGRPKNFQRGPRALHLYS